MKTILQILPSLDLSGGGVERGTLDVAKVASKKGYNAAIISSGGDMAEKYKYKGVSHYNLNIKNKGILNFLLNRAKIDGLLKKIKPDIVHIRSRWPAFCFNNLVKKKGIPLVTTYHGTYSGNNFFLKKSYNKLMTQGDIVISISKFIDDHIRSNFPECKNRLKQINRGIDTVYFSQESVTQIRKENFLSTLSIPENTHIILLPGRITSWKGHEIAIEAAKTIVTRRPELNFSLVFVGSSQSRENHFKRILKKIHSYNLENKIIFCGHFADMPAVYSTADMVLSTSIEPEAFGRISAEASSMMKPIISTNHGGSREIIENDVTGWLIEPKNSTLLAEKILQILDMPEAKKDQIGKNARRRISQKFNLNEMLLKTFNVYEDLIERSKKNFDY